ncbi:MAG TPA: hypothetical protein VFY90_08435 [Tepidiformaceae bacterium]|nr:hypothetical protein [Tepidiformaceae bacterium]
MTRFDKVREQLLSGTSDANIRFDDLCWVLRHLDFQERVRGSHHIFAREGVAEILNLQARADGLSKPYQVKQVRDILWKHGLVRGQK